MIALLMEQTFNGIQYGLVLFLVAAGVTLIFGVMNIVNLAHGALVMVGGYFCAALQERFGSWGVAVIGSLIATGVLALLVELLVMRRLYVRDHLDQVLATFGLILMANEAVVWIWGREPQFMSPPDALDGSIELLPGLDYPLYRLVISAVALVAGGLLWVLIARTRLGMLVRAGAERRRTLETLGVHVPLLFSVVFVLGGVLAALAGMMIGPLIAVQPGMGDPLLILALAVIIVGGAGSITGCFVAALLLGLADTYARTLLPGLIGADAGRAAAGMAVYLAMALVLVARPQGLFGRAAPQ